MHVSRKIISGLWYEGFILICWKAGQNMEETSQVEEMRKKKMKKKRKMRILWRGYFIFKMSLMREQKVFEHSIDCSSISVSELIFVIEVP